ncbi:MAG: metal ABC transporter permease [Atribacterota bacterium]|nr:metal ABC transporter permease [Atribacterota bacterium]
MLSTQGGETLIVEILHLGFMQRALVAGLMVGTLCALLGVFVVLKNLSFVSAGISHAAFGGVALGYLLGTDILLTTFVFCVLVGLGITLLTQKSSLREDTIVGIFYASTMALGIFLLSFSQGYTVDLFGYLFGSILAVTRTDLFITACTLAGVLLLLLLFFKEFMTITLDTETAKVSGIPVEYFNYLLTALVATVIVVAIRVVGIILVSALVAIPAATALRFSREIKKVILWAVSFSLASCILGLFLSFYLNTPSGATIVLLGTGFFLASLFRKSF